MTTTATELGARVVIRPHRGAATRGVASQREAARGGTCRSVRRETRCEMAPVQGYSRSPGRHLTGYYCAMAHPAGDDWNADGPCIVSRERLDAIKLSFETSSLIVEHRHYYGSRGPTIAVLDNFEDFEALLASARPGDSIWCWRYGDLCRDDNPLTHGKYPNADGMTPRGGAY